MMMVDTSCLVNGMRLHARTKNIADSKIHKKSHALYILLSLRYMTTFASRSVIFMSRQEAYDSSWTGNSQPCLDA